MKRLIPLLAFSVGLFAQAMGAGPRDGNLRSKADRPPRKVVVGRHFWTLRQIPGPQPRLVVGGLIDEMA